MEQRGRPSTSCTYKPSNYSQGWNVTPYHGQMRELWDAMKIGAHTCSKLRATDAAFACAKPL